jgi:DtxR family Mn-dependent transcriptional regulator
MSPTDFLRNGLRHVRGKTWDESCPSGAPVPEAHRCAALNCDSVRLTSLVAGQRGNVTCLDNPGSGAACKLAALGVLPGVMIELVRTSPAFVFRIDYSTFAVDAALAELIRVAQEA